MQFSTLLATLFLAASSSAAVFDRQTGAPQDCGATALQGQASDGDTKIARFPCHAGERHTVHLTDATGCHDSDTHGVRDIVVLNERDGQKLAELTQRDLFGLKVQTDPFECPQSQDGDHGHGHRGGFIQVRVQFRNILQDAQRFGIKLENL